MSCLAFLILEISVFFVFFLVHLGKSFSFFFQSFQRTTFGYIDFIVFKLGFLWSFLCLPSIMVSQWLERGSTQPPQASKLSVLCQWTCVWVEEKFQRSSHFQVFPVITFHWALLHLLCVCAQPQGWSALGLAWALSCLAMHSGSLSQEYFVLLTTVTSDWSHHVHSPAPEVVTSTDNTNTPKSSELLSTVVEKLPVLTWQNLALAESLCGLSLGDGVREKYGHP